RRARRESGAVASSASPRNPRVRMARRSSAARSLLVAWRRTLSTASSRDIPEPSSVTSMRRVPPPSMTTRTERAPASRAFSPSSLTTEAGRSTTSPAAIWSMSASLRRAMVGMDSGWSKTARCATPTPLRRATSSAVEEHAPCCNVWLEAVGLEPLVAVHVRARDKCGEGHERPGVAPLPCTPDGARSADLHRAAAVLGGELHNVPIIERNVQLDPVAVAAAGPEGGIGAAFLIIRVRHPDVHPGGDFPLKPADDLQFHVGPRVVTASTRGRGETGREPPEEHRAAGFE